MKAKQEKREQAKKRQEFYNKLTLEEKLDRMEKAPGKCKKQRTKYLKNEKVS